MLLKGYTVLNDGTVLMHVYCINEKQDEKDGQTAQLTKGYEKE